MPVAAPSRPSRAELAAQVARLRKQNLTNAEIGERLGISQSYASCLATDPDRSKEVARRRSYGRACTGCGRRTDGSNGPKAAPTLCDDCTKRARHENRYWTEERLLEAAREWTRRYGRFPTAADWVRAQWRDGYRYPSSSLCYGGPNPRGNSAPWRRWSDFARAAGVEIAATGKYLRVGTAGLGTFQWAVLNALAELGVASSATLSFWVVNKGSSAIGDVLRTLEARGLVERVGTYRGTRWNPMVWRLVTEADRPPR